MANGSYFVVMPFDRDQNGTLVAGDSQNVDNAFVALRLAEAMAFVPGRAGAIAFSRTSDQDTGEFQQPEVIAEYGYTDISALPA